jgi:sec-independent protein translocase protein TatB
LLIIGVIAVIVLGPERLPRAARFAGLWVRRARAQWYSVKSELERELAAEELKRNLQDTRRAVADIDAEIDAGIRNARIEARREFDAIRGDIGIDAGDRAAVAAESEPSPVDPLEYASTDHPQLDPPLPAGTVADASLPIHETRDDRG